MTPLFKVQRARTQLILKFPFFGVLALQLKLRESPDIETAATDGREIIFNPEFVNKLTQNELLGLLAHEVMHPAFLHHTRRGNRDPQKWNMACDYAINPLLKQAGLTLPEGGLDDPKYHGKSSEEIYNLLKQDKDSGSNYGGGQNFGGVMDSPNSEGGGGNASTQAQEEAQWKQNMAQAATAARNAGKLPAHLQRLVDESLQAEIPWKEVLRRFMTERQPAGVDWSRPSRRFIASKIYMPSRREDTAAGEMVFVIDTSGSVSDKELSEMAAEIRAVKEEVKPSKLHVIYCDSEVNHVDTFGPEDEMVVKPHGGGGTDFRPPFTWLEEHGVEPRCLVYLTDGYGPFPQEVDFPVMWAINNKEVTPPWGEHMIYRV